MRNGHESLTTPRWRLRELNGRLADLAETVRRIRHALTELALLLTAIGGLVALLLGWLRQGW